MNQYKKAIYNLICKPYNHQPPYSHHVYCAHVWIYIRMVLFLSFIIVETVCESIYDSRYECWYLLRDVTYMESIYVGYTLMLWMVYMQVDFIWMKLKCQIYMLGIYQCMTWIVYMQVLIFCLNERKVYMLGI